MGRSDLGGDPIVVVLATRVSDAHLMGLRSDGVFGIFAGDDQLDLSAALESSQPLEIRAVWLRYRPQNAQSR